MSDKLWTCVFWLLCCGTISNLISDVYILNIWSDTRQHHTDFKYLHFVWSPEHRQTNLWKLKINFYENQGKKLFQMVSCEQLQVTFTAGWLRVTLGWDEVSARLPALDRFPHTNYCVPWVSEIPLVHGCSGTSLNGDKTDELFPTFSLQDMTKEKHTALQFNFNERWWVHCTIKLFQTHTLIRRSQRHPRDTGRWTTRCRLGIGQNLFVPPLLSPFLALETFPRHWSIRQPARQTNKWN